MEVAARDKTEKIASSLLECEGFASIFFDCIGEVHHEFLTSLDTIITFGLSLLSVFNTNINFHDYLISEIFFAWISTS